MFEDDKKRFLKKNGQSIGMVHLDELDLIMRMEKCGAKKVFLNIRTFDIHDLRDRTTLEPDKRKILSSNINERYRMDDDGTTTM